MYNVYKIKLTAKDSSHMLLNTFRSSHNFSNSDKLNDTLLPFTMSLICKYATPWKGMTLTLFVFEKMQFAYSKFPSSFRLYVNMLMKAIFIVLFGFTESTI